MVRKLQNLLIFLLLAMGVEGNNIRSGSTVEIVEVVGDTAVLQFDLQWDNSWRDDYNWDAAWVFLKYKETGGDWQPVYLGAGGHAFTGDYTYMTGKSGVNVTGLYVFRSKNGAGNVSTTCRLKWKLPAGVTQEKFKKNQAFIMAQAVEMVLVPYGAYYLGDGVSERSFVDASGNAILMDSEEAKGLKIKDDASVFNLTEVYPKGYKGFYVMKYELSQEQYVAFLNTLTFAQQAERVPGLVTMKQGEYVFGNCTKPNNRNGIIVNVPSTGTVPVIFANNLNNDGKYNQTDDGKTIACNYMTPEDMYTYCSWAGLRPMSELEYEKASRTPYPETPKPGEYAWNDNATPDKASTINNGGMANERPAGGIVNAGSLIGGPVRSGSFAKTGSSQVQAGATYWGVMEMSGNLKELCIAATGTLDGSVSGSGAYSKAVAGWTVTPAHYGLRGGGFTSADEQLRTSDRSAMNAVTNRDSTVGFRGVMSDFSVSDIEEGRIVAPNGLSVDTACAGSRVILKETETDRKERVSYYWYISENDGVTWTLVERGNGKDLVYDRFINETAILKLYKFKRKTVSPLNETSQEVSIYIMNNPFASDKQIFMNTPNELQIASAWKSGLIGGWTLQNAPVGVQISSSGQVTNIPTDAVINFITTVTPAKCPGIVYSQAIELKREYAYTGGEQTIQLPSGSYQIECWGAEGGRSRADGSLAGVSGMGGYCTGEFHLNRDTRFYLYVGGKGANAAGSTGGAGGWNGGGRGGNDSDNDPSGGGGGASDMRLVSGDLLSRIMVAGGGGGVAWYSTGGAGGGLSGTNSNGATQTDGFKLGVGEAGGNVDTPCKVGGGGGGGGYYGARRLNCGAGGGGSGFVSGFSGCNAMNADGVHTGQPNHYSGIVFENAKMETGVRSGGGLIRIGVSTSTK